ncbi:MAG TPA: hypothetical protein VHY84_19315 [Bryobacteraceae bacterium]|jgi:hypothetical protein|nr:hypothetical protein [Bryobacteraceae bacterium]
MMASEAREAIEAAFDRQRGVEVRITAATRTLLPVMKASGLDVAELEKAFAELEAIEQEMKSSLGKAPGRPC